MRLNDGCISALVIIEFFWVVLAALSNLYKVKDEEHFKMIYKGKRKLLEHWGYMIVLVSVFMAYALGTPIMYKNARLGMFAYGASFIQGTLHALLSVPSKECYTPYRRTNVLCWILIMI